MIGQKFTITKAGWHNNRRTAYFGYTIETNERTFELEETLTLSQAIPETVEAEKLLRALHIALAISYYKSFLPPIIEHPYEMSEVEAQFWNTVYRHGLGEFLFTNALSSSKIATFSAQPGLKIVSNSSVSWRDSAILGLGGGKDSIVAGELLKEAAIPLEGFVLATGDIVGQTKAVSDVMGIHTNTIQRTLDPQILVINTIEGAYNGHIPISLIFGLVGALIAVTTHSRYVVVANESSASIPQTTWEDEHINHQWSKSIEFERLFQDYLHAYVSEEIQYFSAIRPLTSVAIAKIFSAFPQYFEVFTSDNSVFKIKQNVREHPRWSLHSTKSLSSYILLAPWISNEDLIRIFGRNYFDEASLSKIFMDLLGATNTAVLDCVGTPDELRASLSEIIRQGRFTDSALVNYTKDKQLAKSGSLESFMALQNHAMPDTIASVLLPITRSHINDF